MALYKDTTGDKIFKIINYTLLALLGISTLYPFIYFFIISFNDGFDAIKGGIYFWPRMFTLENYRIAFSNHLILSSFKISILRTVITTIFSLLLTAMMAYALTKKELPGRTAIIFYFFFTTLFSGGLIPRFILYRGMHLTDNFWIYVIPGLYSFYNTIVMRTFFENIPSSLSESAMIDGCSDVGIFLKIYLRLSFPVIATLALFIGVGNWNDWFTGAYFVTKEKLFPAATLLNKLLNEATFESAMNVGEGGRVNISDSMVGQTTKITPESLRVTFLIILTLPIICVYPFLQKYFVNGIMIGSIKE